MGISGAVDGCVDICELLEIPGHDTIIVMSPTGSVNINPYLVNINSRLAYNIPNSDIPCVANGSVDMCYLSERSSHDIIITCGVVMHAVNINPCCKHKS